VLVLGEHIGAMAVAGLALILGGRGSRRAGAIPTQAEGVRRNINNDPNAADATKMLATSTGSEWISAP
jgi:hypothetical protein